MLCNGLLSRIFQHEVDHLNGRVMWQETGEEPDHVPRRIEKSQSIGEISDEQSLAQFYEENKRFMFES